MFDRVEAQRSQPDRVPHRLVDLLDTERLHEPEHLNELPLASSAHPRLQQPAQGTELLGEVPSGKWRRLVQRTGLVLQQRQVVDGIEHEVVSVVGATVTGDHVRTAADDHLVDIPSDQHLSVSVCDRRRVVVGAVSDQRQRAHTGQVPVARVIRHCRQRQEGVEITHHALAYRLCVAPELRLHPIQAPLLEVGVESLEAIERWDRNKEVPPGVSDHTLDLALVVALARTSEPVLEQVVRLKLCEHSCASATTVSQYPGNCQTGVVVHDALWNSSKERERRHMSVAERLGGLGGVCPDEHGIAVGQVQDEEVDPCFRQGQALPLHSAYDSQCLSEVALRVSRRMR